MSGFACTWRKGTQQQQHAEGGLERVGSEGEGGGISPYLRCCFVLLLPPRLRPRRAAAVLAGPQRAAGAARRCHANAPPRRRGELLPLPDRRPRQPGFHESQPQPPCGVCCCVRVRDGGEQQRRGVWQQRATV
jgi:hypothetical protein